MLVFLLLNEVNIPIGALAELLESDHGTLSAITDKTLSVIKARCVQSYFFHEYYHCFDLFKGQSS